MRHLPQLPEERPHFRYEQAYDKPEAVADPANEGVQRNLLCAPAIGKQPINKCPRAPAREPRRPAAPNNPPNERSVCEVEEQPEADVHVA